MKSNLLWLYGNDTATLYENITDYEVDYQMGSVKFTDEHGNQVFHHGNFTFVVEPE